jgi:hypothetical protein
VGATATLFLPGGATQEVGSGTHHLTVRA